MLGEQRDDLVKYIRQISNICDAMVHRLAQAESANLLELKLIAEDTGNGLLQVASEVEERVATANNLVIKGMKLRIIRGGRCPVEGSVASNPLRP